MNDNVLPRAHSLIGYAMPMSDGSEIIVESYRCATSGNYFSPWIVVSSTASYTASSNQGTSAVCLLAKLNVYRRGRDMRRTVVRKKSGQELIAIVAIYACVLI